MNCGPKMKIFICLVFSTLVTAQESPPLDEKSNGGINVQNGTSAPQECYEYRLKELEKNKTIEENKRKLVEAEAKRKLYERNIAMIKHQIEKLQHVEGNLSNDLNDTLDDLQKQQRELAECLVKLDDLKYENEKLVKDLKDAKDRKKEREKREEDDKQYLEKIQGESITLEENHTKVSKENEELEKATKKDEEDLKQLEKDIEDLMQKVQFLEEKIKKGLN